MKKPEHSSEFPLLTWQEWNEVYSICYNESYGNRTAAFNAAYAKKMARWLEGWEAELATYDVIGFERTVIGEKAAELRRMVKEQP